jgi:hypothetical protein
MTCPALSLANLYLPPPQLLSLSFVSNPMYRASILGTRKICNRLDCPTPRTSHPHPIPFHGALFSFWLVENGPSAWLGGPTLDTVDRIPSMQSQPTSNKYIKVFPRLKSSFSSRLYSPYSVPFSISTRLLPYLPRIGGTFLPHPVSHITYWITPSSPTDQRRTTSISSILIFSVSSIIKHHPNIRIEARRYSIYDNPTCLTLSPDPQRLSMAPTRSLVVIPVCFYLRRHTKSIITAS